MRQSRRSTDTFRKSSLWFGTFSVRAGDSADTGFTIRSNAFQSASRSRERGDRKVRSRGKDEGDFIGGILLMVFGVFLFGWGVKLLCKAVANAVRQHNPAQADGTAAKK